MLVQCPSCHVTYRVSDSLVTKSGPTFRCSRCRHVFVLGSKPETDLGQKTPSSPSPNQQEDDQELSFPFSPAEEKETREGEEELEISISRAAEEPPPFSMDDSDTTAEVELPAQGAIAGTEAESEKRGRPLSALPLISLFGAILIIYSLLAFLGQAQPRRLEGFLKGIPWVGSSISKNSHLRQGIFLHSLRSRLQRILGNREVLVISGMVANRSRVSVREIRIEGLVFNAEGKEIERQAVSVGNAISLKALSGLTAQDIPILQKTQPGKSFQVPPGESASFVMVFLNPASEVEQFGWRVLSAEEAF